jgi:Holliday junction resolvase
MPKNQDAFVENEQVEVNRPRRLSLKLDEEGHIDWSSTSAKVKEQFADVVANDPEALETIGLAAGATEVENPLEVTVEHVKDFLDAYVWIEQFAIPKFIAVKTKGKLVIPDDISAQAFTISPEAKDKLAPSGAQWANENIPEWMRKWLLLIGPGAQFFGGLALITMTQTKTALRMTAERMQTEGQQQQPVTGEAA